MNRTTLRKQKAALRRRETKQAFIPLLPENVLAPKAVETIPKLGTTTGRLRPGDEFILREIDHLRGEVRALLQRASLKIATRALLEGLQSGADPSTK